MQVALPPQQAVLLWLAEAQAHGSLPAYARWLLEHPAQVHPLVRITEQATAATRTDLRGADREEASREVARTTRHACILFALVLRIEVATDALVRVHAPLLAALALGPAGPRKAMTRDAVATLDAHERTMRSLQVNHVDGVDTLFPDTAMAWADVCERTRSMAGGQVPTDTAGRPDGSLDLLGAAKADALVLVGETVAAASIVARRLSVAG